MRFTSKLTSQSKNGMKFYIRVKINDNNFKTLNGTYEDNAIIWTQISDVAEVDVDYRNIIEYEIY